MWKVVMSQLCEKQLKLDFKNGLFTKEDGDVIKLWIHEITLYGPEYIQKSKKWDDHELYAEWAKHRSSCFSRRGRIIYKEVDDSIEITVVKITPNHDYSK